MNEIPKRLVVIEARIPTGERCDGCQYTWLHQAERPGFCALFNTYRTVDGQHVPDTWTASTARLPACLARDSYQVVVPGSAVAKLIAASLAYDRACEAHEAVKDEWGVIGPEFNASLLQLRSARRRMKTAARKVAEERRK